MFIAKLKENSDIDKISEEFDSSTEGYVTKKLNHLNMIIFESPPEVAQIFETNEFVIYVKSSSKVGIQDTGINEHENDTSLVSETIYDENEKSTIVGKFGGKDVYYSHLEILAKRNLSETLHQYDPIYTGKNVDCYIIDTGVRYDHPLLPNVSKLDSFKSGYRVKGEPDSSNDDNGHGTEIALFVTGNLCGVASDVNIIPLKVVSRNGVGDNFNIAIAINEVIEDHLNKTSNRPSVINYSLGMMPSSTDPNYYPDETGDDAITLDALKLATSKGVHVVAAAGNGFMGRNSLIGPMMSKFTNGSMNLSSEISGNNDPGQGLPIVVGATTTGNKENGVDMADFSNYGVGNTLNAPGTDLPIPRYDWIGNLYERYKWRKGTSFSCPIVVGLLCLYLEENPNSSVHNAKKWLTDNSSKSKISNLMSSIYLKNVKFEFKIDTNIISATFDEVNFSKEQLSNRKVQIIGFGDDIESIGLDTWYEVTKIKNNSISLNYDQTIVNDKTIFKDTVKLSFLDDTHESTDGIMKWQTESDKNRIILHESLTTDEYFQLFNVDETQNNLVFNPYIKTKIWYSDEFGNEYELKNNLLPSPTKIIFISSTRDMGVRPKFSVLYSDNTADVTELKFTVYKNEKYYYEANFQDKSITSIYRGNDLEKAKNSVLLESSIIFDESLKSKSNEKQLELLSYFEKIKKQHKIESFDSYNKNEKENSISNVVFLKSSDFDTGTVRIRKSGYYYLTEDVFFHPNESNDFFPTTEQIRSELYPMGRGGAYHLGFFAAITIECEDVVLDLNGYIIEQSKLHNLKQRFFSVIELANAPFIPSQGPHSFSESFSPAKNVLVVNGTLGLSSHHGIHGNLVDNVVLSDIEIKNFEVAGIALNGTTNGVITNTKIEGTHLRIPVNSMFSQSVFIGRHLQQIKNRLQDSNVLNLPSCGHTKANLPNKTHVQTTFIQNEDTPNEFGLELKEGLLTLDQVLKNLVNDINEVVNNVKNNEKVENYFENQSGFYDGNMYGIVLNVAGVVIHDFLKTRTTDSIGNKNILLTNIEIRNIKSEPVEILAVENEKGDLQSGPFGDIFDISLVAKTMDNMCKYHGNSLSDAQLFLEKYEQYGKTYDLSKIESCILNWAETGSNLSTNMVDEKLKLISNRDSMGHVMKGNIGLFVSGGLDHKIDGVTIDGVQTKGEFYRNIEIFDESLIETPSNKMGSSASGVLITGSENLNFNNMKIENVDSEILDSRICNVRMISGKNINGIRETCIMETVGEYNLQFDEKQTCLVGKKLNFILDINSVEQKDLLFLVYENNKIKKRYRYGAVVGNQRIEATYNYRPSGTPTKVTAILTDKGWKEKTAKDTINLKKCEYLQNHKIIGESDSAKIMVDYDFQEEMNIVVRLLANRKILKTKRFKNLNGTGSLVDSIEYDKSKGDVTHAMIFASKDTYKNRISSARVEVQEPYLISFNSNNICFKNGMIDVDFDYELSEEYDVILQIYSDNERLTNVRVKKLSGVGNQAKKIRIKDTTKTPTRIVAIVTKNLWKNKIERKVLDNVEVCVTPGIKLLEESVCIHDNLITTDIDYENVDSDMKLVVSVYSDKQREQSFTYNDISGTGSFSKKEMKLRKNFKPKKIIAFLTKSDWKERVSQYTTDVVAECVIEKEETGTNKMFTPVCPSDVRLCDDGKTLVRDPRNNCEFPMCNSKEVSNCTADVTICENGEVVGRNPFDDCNWYSCDKVGTILPIEDDETTVCTTDVKYCKDGSIVSRDHLSDCKFFMCPEEYRYDGDGDEPKACTRELKVCSDGTAVGRNPFNNCEFHECPETDEVNPPVVDGRVCTKDVKMCESGFMVTRDPNNDCKWKPCPPSVMNGIYLSDVIVNTDVTELNVEIIVELLEGTDAWKYQIENEDEVTVNSDSVKVTFEMGIHKLKVWGVDSTGKQIGRIFYEKVEIEEDVFAPMPEPAEFDEDLFIKNKKLWEDKQINNYSFVVSRSYFGPPNSWKPVKVYVEDGNITNVRFVDRRFLVKPEMDQYMTLTEMFDYALDHHNSKVAKLDISYDPEHGFIDNIYVDVDRMLVDEEMGIKITDFEVMDISIPEPPVQIECFPTEVNVDVIDKNYIFNLIDYDEKVEIQESHESLKIGLNMYHLTNISSEHPIGIHTNSDDVGIMSEKLIEIKPHGDIVINVSGGSMSSPHYTFKLEDGTNISSDVYNGEFKFMKNKMYVFKNAGVSGVHPFKIGKSRDLDLDWVNGTQLDAQTAEITMKIPFDYEDNIIYYCKNHSTMTSNPLGILSKTALNGEQINFYYGDIEMCVNGDFGTTSYECYYHGYMGGENKLVFSEFCGKSLDDKDDYDYEDGKKDDYDYEDDSSDEKKNELMQSISHAGVNREYILYVPNSYQASNNVPLVFNFHGYGGTAEDHMNTADMRPLADMNGAILVYPQGLELNNIVQSKDEDYSTHWNTGIPGDEGNKSNSDDLGFIETLIDHLTTEYNIDEDRIYTCGFSNGAFFSYALGCHLGSKIAGIGSVAGTMLMEDINNECKPAKPISMINIHGMRDDVVPYTGNETGYRKIADVVNFWVTHNSTTSMEVTEENGITHYNYTNGANSTKVDHYVVSNGYHAWDDSLNYNGNNTSELVWNFFMPAPVEDDVVIQPPSEAPEASTPPENDEEDIFLP